MKLYIGVTDHNWFQFLSQLQPDEINFWQPGGKQAFAALSPGEPFLFKLHSPLHFIVGGGFFVRHSFLPLSLAWEAFEKKNGSAEFDTFNNHVRKYRASKGQVEIDPVIGCIILANPFFFEEADWIPIPANWSPNIVQGKTYNTEDQIGLNLWRQVQERIEKESRSQTAAQYALPLEAAMSDRYGNEYLTKPRLGQGAFRVLVTEAYQRRCAITGERTLPVLNASHIKPYAKAGPHDVSNGLLLREDLHTIFDRGYLTITKDFVIEVSHRLKEDYGNGKDYYAMHGRKLLILPENPAEQPSPEYIRWHNENVYAS
jgi:putative restriction endonuclease